jgi:cell division protein FtsL
VVKDTLTLHEKKQKRLEKVIMMFMLIAVVSRVLFIILFKKSPQWQLKDIFSSDNQIV